MLTHISQLNDWRANKALVPEHVLVLLLAHLLVPPEGLHLRDELRVILRRRDGAALGAALQHHFLQQHTHRALLILSPDYYAHHITTYSQEQSFYRASWIRAVMTVFFIFMAQNTHARAYASQARLLIMPGGSHLVAIHEATMSKWPCEPPCHSPPYQDSLQLQNETDKISRLLQPLWGVKHERKDILEWRDNEVTVSIFFL